MTRLLAVGILLLGISATGFAQEYERILLPIAFSGPFSGALGTRWGTSITIFNGTEREVRFPSDIGRLADCLLIPECLTSIPAKFSAQPSLYFVAPLVRIRHQ